MGYVGPPTMRRSSSRTGTVAQSTPALVTDVHLRNVVAGLRGLGRGGVRVLALGPGRGAAGLWSRHVRRRLLGPDVSHDPTGYLAAVRRAVSAEGPMVVYPGWERSLQAVLDARATLPATAVLPYPENGSVAAIRDKRRVAELAGDAGLGTPPALMTGTAEELRGGTLRPPCVVKPVTSGGAMASARVVRGEDELAAVLGALPSGEQLLVQERVTGTLGAVTVVVGRDGSLVARFQQAARRTWPMDAGASSVAVSVAPDERFVARLGAMLASAGYWGLAQLQFVETGSGRAVIDVNPRFYGSLPLALAAGVNLPAAWHAVAVDAPVPTPGRYRVGVGYRWLESDFVAAALGAPGRLLERRPRPGTGAMWATDDPIPGIALAVGAVTTRVRRGLPGAAPRARTAA